MAAPAQDDCIRGKICLATMNMIPFTPTSQPGVGRTERSRQSISQSVEAKQPDILFAQEIAAPKQVNWKLIGMDNYQFLNKNEKAGLVYNPEKCEAIEDFHSTDAYMELLAPFFEENDRLCLALLRHRDTEYRLLCISWQGRWNKEDGRGRMTIEQKLTDKWLSLMRMIQRMRGANAHRPCYDAIVVGGNFNIKASVLVEYLTKCNRTPGVHWEIKFGSPHHSNYFLFHDFEGLNVEILEDNYEGGDGEGGVKWLRHNAVYADTQFTKPNAQQTVMDKTRPADGNGEGLDIDGI